MYVRNVTLKHNYKVKFNVSKSEHYVSDSNMSKHDPRLLNINKISQKFCLLFFRVSNKKVNIYVESKNLQWSEKNLFF